MTLSTTSPTASAAVPVDQDRLQALANLEAWLETMRGPDGYGGPVVHWWQHCLQFTGAGLDWRYEGIIAGYLTLWQRTGAARWLAKAVRAGDDLCRGQLPNGRFRHSSFELNPYSGGTPHEAAVDLALLQLAAALRQAGDPRWLTYAGAAEHNLRRCFIAALWDPAARRFADNLAHTSFVPNKACTLAEALLALADLQGDDNLLHRYVLPTLEAVLALQQSAGGHLHGAIAQAENQGRPVPAYFPYYVARCLPALLQAHQRTGAARWRKAAAAAVAFIGRHIDDAGLLPQVVYPRGRNRFPHWLAPLGDVLRLLHLAHDCAAIPLPAGIVRLDAALLAAQQPAGGFATARGFSARFGRRAPGPLPAFFDLLPVAGWNDKTFRYLAAGLPAGAVVPPPATAPADMPCTFRGRACRWQEDAAAMSLRCSADLLYRWEKGAPWATVSAPEVMWK